MKYFYDTEFLEGTQDISQWVLKTGHWLRIFAYLFFIAAVFISLHFEFSFLRVAIAMLFFIPGAFLSYLSIPKTPPTIDLISIGIVSEDNREYYAISKDFNLDEAWNRYEWKDFPNIHDNKKLHQKVYWIRENVLYPIWKHLYSIYEIDTFILSPKAYDDFKQKLDEGFYDVGFTKKSLKRLLHRYGKSNNKISEEIIEFCNYGSAYDDLINGTVVCWTTDDEKNIEEWNHLENVFPLNPIEFYGYYSAYDHVALCWLFGKMIDLPKGFPMYTIDLKQMLDEKQQWWSSLTEEERTEKCLKKYKNLVHFNLKQLPDFPKQENEHDALDDAKWNLKLYKFLTRHETTRPTP